MLQNAGLFGHLFRGDQALDVALRIGQRGENRVPAEDPVRRILTGAALVRTNGNLDRTARTAGALALAAAGLAAFGLTEMPAAFAAVAARSVTRIVAPVITAIVTARSPAVASLAVAARSARAVIAPGFPVTAVVPVPTGRTVATILTGAARIPVVAVTEVAPWPVLAVAPGRTVVAIPEIPARAVAAPVVAVAPGRPIIAVAAGASRTLAAAVSEIAPGPVVAVTPRPT